LKLSITKQNLLTQLAKASAIASKTSNLSITENVLLHTKQNILSITATNLDSSFYSECEASIEAEGAVCMNAKKLFEIIKNFPQDIIDITCDNKWVELKTDSVKFNIAGIDANNFPALPDIDDIKYSFIDSNSFKQMIEKTIAVPAASDEKRSYINGVYFENHDEKFRMVSTDNRRIHLADSNIKFGFTDNFLVQKKALAELLKIVPNSSQISIAVNNSYLIIKDDPDIVMVRLLEGKFPRYHSAVSVTSFDKIEFDKEILKKAIKRMSILYNDTTKGFFFKIKDEVLEISVLNANIGESKETIEAIGCCHNIEISFNPLLLLGALNMIDEDNVCVYLKDKNAPCIIEGKNDKNFLALIMPV
jgi:DNA polymerase-3 subunit beta